MLMGQLAGNVGRVTRALLGPRPVMQANFMGEALPSGWTFARASNATRVGPTGAVEFAPANELGWSTDLSNGAWAGGPLPPSRVGGQADPFGGNGAYLVTAQAGGPTTYGGMIRTYGAVGVAGARRVSSVYAKAGTSSFLGIRPNGDSSKSGQTDVYAGFNLATGVATPVTPTAGSIDAMGMVNVGNGWWRCWIAYTAAASTGVLDLVVMKDANYNSGAAYAGTESLYLYGPQMQPALGSTAPTGYVPTTSAGRFGARFDYNPTTLDTLGILIEGQSTNMLTASGNVADATQWPGQIQCSRASGQAAPDGSTAGVLVTVTTSSGARNETGNVAITTATTYSASVWMKAGTANGGMAFGDGGGTVYAYVKATLTGAGSVATSGAGAVASIQRFPGGWYRVTLSYTSSTTTVRLSLHPWDGTADQFAYPAGAVGASCAFWGAQLEAQPCSTSYIPTFASAATRAADVCTLTLGAWWNNTKGTLLTDCAVIPAHANAPTWPHIINVDDGTTANTFQVFAQVNATTRDLGMFSRSGGVNAVNQGVGLGMAPAVPHRIAFGWQYGSGLFRGSSDGAPVVTQAEGAQPVGVTTMRLGYQSQGGVRHVRRVAYYANLLTDAQLRSVSA